MSGQPGRTLAGPTATYSPMLSRLAGGGGAVIKLGELVMILEPSVFPLEGRTGGAPDWERKNEKPHCKVAGPGPA